ncbi:MAG: AIPR family protein, partial [Thermodesulfobacteriota bacterium]
MSTSVKFPHEYRIPVSQEHIRSIKDPQRSELTTLHALVKVRELPNGKIPDKINPRSHEDIKMNRRVPQAIADSLKDFPELFHLLNRGCLILAKKAWYDNQSKLLHFIVESEDEHGMVDGATTDRVLAALKKEVSNADFASLKEDEIPPHFKDAYIHLEVVAGEIGEDLRIKLAGARNTSDQVKEFSLEDLKGHFDWLKEIL